jgi:hypothetical protein
VSGAGDASPSTGFTSKEESTATATANVAARNFNGTGTGNFKNYGLLK